jgi:hypothetical protein
MNWDNFFVMTVAQVIEIVIVRILVTGKHEYIYLAVMLSFGDAVFSHYE